MEGAGKSSAIRVVEEVLAEQRNIAYAKTREPGGTPLAESLRDNSEISERMKKR